MGKIKHGHAYRKKESKEYSAWRGMHERCNHKSTKNFHCWGGKGIKVCDRWEDFQNFLNDLGYAPSDNHSIDRIDNNKGYSPDNCRWATNKEQHRNRTNNCWVEFNGIRRLLIELAEEFQVNYQTLYGRIYCRDWPLEEALMGRKKRGGTKPKC